MVGQNPGVVSGVWRTYDATFNVPIQVLMAHIDVDVWHFKIMFKVSVILRSVSFSRYIFGVVVCCHHEKGN